MPWNYYVAIAVDHRRQTFSALVLEFAATTSTTTTTVRYGLVFASDDAPLLLLTASQIARVSLLIYGFN